MKLAMHELAITENILQLALRHASAAEARRVTDLHLVIGQLSSVVDDCVQFYWDLISQDTLCEGATLHFERIPATLLCCTCGHRYTLTQGLEACPRCDDYHVEVVAGDEFRLESIDVET